MRTDSFDKLMNIVRNKRTLSFMKVMHSKRPRHTF